MARDPNSRLASGLVLALCLASFAGLGGCANQKDVTPLLRVDPNAASRFLYFEKRAAAMIREQRGPEAEPDQPDQEEDPECTLGERPLRTPPLRTWGAPDPEEGRDPEEGEQGQGISCDRAQND